MSSINDQSVDINTSNNQLHTAQLYSGESDMNDQHQVCEPQQQHYAQPTVYYDDNDIQQREGVLRSLAQNPHMLIEFYQFLEFTRARTAHQSF
jgi:hypothetical protein